MKQEARSREVLLLKRNKSLNVSPGEKKTNWILIQVFLFVWVEQNFAEPPHCVVRTLIHENNLVRQFAIRSTVHQVESGVPREPGAQGR